jgi:hypothetical protein
VDDRDLTLNEKRAMLASWASEACADEAVREFRRSASGPVIRIEEIMDALRTIDAQALLRGEPTLLSCARTSNSRFVRAPS